MEDDPVSVGGDEINVAVSVSVTVFVISDVGDDPGRAGIEVSLPTREVRVECPDPPPPITFVSVQGTVMTVEVVSVVTEPIRAGQSVIVAAQEVMV